MAQASFREFALVRDDCAISFGHVFGKVLINLLRAARSLPWDYRFNHTVGIELPEVIDVEYGLRWDHVPVGACSETTSWPMFIKRLFQSFAR